MIKELNLVNWKSFENAKLFIDPLTFLIGTNASGKSNVLDAFNFLYRIASGKQIQTAISGDSEIKPIRGGIDWFLKKNSQSESSTIEIILETDSKGFDYKYSIEIRKVDEKSCELASESLSLIARSPVYRDRQLFYTANTEPGAPGIHAYFYTAKRGKQRKITLNRAYSIIGQVDKLNVLKEIKDAATTVVSFLQNIFILDPISNHMRDYTKLSDTLAPDASNIAGVLAALPDERRKEIEMALSTYTKPLPEKDINKVWVEKVGRFASDAMLYCEEKWSENESVEVDARGMSDGTLRFLAIITALLLGKENSLLIIEEIDNGLHPSRAKLLVEVLKELSEKRKIDIVCTTHNPAFINALGNSMIPFISYVSRDKANGNSKISLLEDLDNLPKLMASDSLGNLMIKNAFK